MPVHANVVIWEVQGVRTDLFDDPAVAEKFLAHRRGQGSWSDPVEGAAMGAAVASAGLRRRILEIGCGLGGGVESLLNDGVERITAVDRSEALIDAARRRIHDPRVSFIPADICALKFDAGTFDLVTASLTFHFVEKLDELLRQIANWLEPGGVLLFSVRHPIRTAYTNGESTKGGEWSVSDYFVQSERIWHWLGEEFTIFHRTVERYFTAIRSSGLIVKSIIEPSGDPLESSPPFLLFVCGRLGE